MAIRTPLASIDSYIAYFAGADIPVLRRSMRELAELRKDEENVAGRRIASVVLQDPLLALRVLVYLEANRRRSQNHDITTVERAIMMMGITPFFSRFCDLPTIEAGLAQHPKALIGVLKVITRAKTAADLARDWAILRHDIDVDEVTVAALLHDVAEILLWCFAPEAMLQVARDLQATPGLRSAQAQTQHLGYTVHEIQLALVRAWHLPELLITLMDEKQADNARVRNVVLACNMARHLANGWDDPALPDDYKGVADLLHLSLDNTLYRLGVPSEHWPAGLTPGG